MPIITVSRKLPKLISPVTDDGEVEQEVVGQRGRPLGPSLVGADDDAVLPVDHAVTNPFAEQRLNLFKDFRMSLKHRDRVFPYRGHECTAWVMHAQEIELNISIQ